MNETITSFSFFTAWDLVLITTAVAALLYSYRDLPKLKLKILLVVSLILVGSCGLTSLAVFTGISLVTFLLGRKISSKNNDKDKRSFLMFGVSFIFVGWFFFKSRMSERFGFSGSMPVGLSFYSFLAISYLADIYWGILETAASPLEFASWIAYYPKFLMGPVFRFNEFKSETEVERGLNLPNAKWAISSIIIGLGKVQLSFICGPFIEKVFSHFLEFSSGSLWAGIIGLAGQIFGSFSGFIDVLMGISLLFGIAMPKNFDRPYLASSPLEFWSARWHITLSQWIKSYIFLPIAIKFRDRGHLGLLIAFFVSMFSGAIWHEFSLTFLLFFLFHFLLCTCWFIFENALTIRFLVPKLKLALKIALTFYFMVLGQCIIHFSSLDSYLKFLRRAHAFSADVALAKISDGAIITLLATGLIFLIDWLWTSARIQKYILDHFWSFLVSIALIIWILSPQLFSGSMPQFFYARF